MVSASNTHPARLVESMGRQIQNVFHVLTKPNHPLRGDALRLRAEMSSAWRSQATRQQWFAWPTTNAPRGLHHLGQVDWPPIGMLRFLGYRVGETDPVCFEMRKQILEFAFECHLPPLNDATYHQAWGKPSTSPRLQKIADSLASFARNSKRRRTCSYAAAIDDWESDLNFLFDRYYRGYFHFWWPGTDVTH